VNDVGGINHMKRSVQYVATVHNPAKFWISLGNPILVRQYGEQLIRIKGPGDIDPA
jgi:hypothetical protein